ncbi:hypothetical protein DL96DRAFT_1607713, partial [Flagelloscypha sp. PMI_526]
MSHSTPESGTEQHYSLDIESFRARKPTGLRRFSRHNTRGCLSYFIPFWFLWIPTILLTLVLGAVWVMVSIVSIGGGVVSLVTHQWSKEVTDESYGEHYFASLIAGVLFSPFMIAGFIVTASDWWETNKKTLPPWLLKPEYVFGEAFLLGLVCCALAGTKGDHTNSLQLIIEYCVGLVVLGGGLFLMLTFYMQLISWCERR